MSLSCRACTDPDCPKRGTDNTACEDWTNEPQVGLEGAKPETQDQNGTSQAALEARVRALERIVSALQRSLGSWAQSMDGER